MTSFEPPTPNRRSRGRASRRRLFLPVMLVGLVAAAAIGAGAWLVLSDDEGRGEGGPAPQTLKKATWADRSLPEKDLFPKYRDLGIGIYQTHALWDRLAPTRPAKPRNPDDPAYVWEELDQEVAEAEGHGMEVTLMMIGTPEWANGGREWRWTPNDPSDYADFATALSRRYPSVDLFMVWGEPNREPNFGPFTGAPKTDDTELTLEQQRAPRKYAQLLDAAYGALKADDRDNLVIGGNTMLGAGQEVIRPYQWIRYMELPDGSRPRMDMYGHNPHPTRLPDFSNPPSPKGRADFSDLRRLAERLDATFPGPPLKLFLSEFGIPTGRDLDLEYEVDPKAALKWWRAAIKLTGEWDRIYTLGLGIPVDSDRNPIGVMDRKGRPKPGIYQAFKHG